MPTAVRGRIVAGLRLVAPVGAGGEGEVWDARDPLGRRRALKLIRPDALVDPVDVEHRGAWLVRVDDPALARVWRTGILRGGGLDGWGFVEMAFVEGRALDRAPADPHAPERLLPLALALDRLHAGHWSGGTPLVHRDVKPANLIETPAGELVLVDHSTLRAADADALTRIGTPLFAAPEVVTGRMGPPADVYSFCATVVALATGLRGPALAEALEDPWRLDLPAGVAAGLSASAAARPARCAAALAGGGRGGVARVTPPAAAEAAVAGGVGGWLAALGLAGAAPVAVAALGLSPVPEGAAVLAGALALHVGSHALAGRSLATALVAPPLAWALLLADRAAAPGRGRDWARALFLAGTLAVTAAGVAAIAPRGTGVPGAPGGAAALLAAALSVMGLGAASLEPARWPLRLALLPLWAVGAAVLLAGGLALLPLALPLGRARPLLGLVGRTAGSVAAVAGLGRDRRSAGSAPEAA